MYFGLESRRFQADFDKITDFCSQKEVNHGPITFLQLNHGGIRSFNR